PLETRRERPVSPSRGVNLPVGPRPRRWGLGSVQRYAENAQTLRTATPRSRHRPPSRPRAPKRTSASPWRAATCAPTTVPPPQVTSASGARFAAEKLGVARVVLGRELSVKEMAQVSTGAPGVQLEAFVHGALCVSYSGQCFSSEAWGGRSANRGQCAQAPGRRLDQGRRHDRPRGQRQIPAITA
ncbi:unnamed protein product, partial [Prorocentrum cordatum]